jgi:hypothetical protein
MALGGAFKVVTATRRVATAHIPVPFPYGALASIRRVKSMMVTAAHGNAGTVHIGFNPATGMGATVNQTVTTSIGRERTQMALTAGQSITLSGMTFGGRAEHDIAFGSGLTYICSSGTSNGAICSWLEQI